MNEIDIEQIFKQSLQNNQIKPDKNLWNKIDNKLKNSIDLPKNQGYVTNSINIALKTVIAIAFATPIIIISYVVINNYTKKTETNNSKTEIVKIENKQDTKEISLQKIESNNNIKIDTKNSVETLQDFDIEYDNDDYYSQYEEDYASQLEQIAINQPEIVTQSTNNNIENEEFIKTDTTNITLQQEKIDIQIPNVITPNDDGINDCFIIKNIENYPNNTLIIYNRQGKTIYKANYYKNDFCGQNMQNGAYIYQIVIKYKEKTHSFNGSLTILR